MKTRLIFLVCLIPSIMWSQDFDDPRFVRITGNLKVRTLVFDPTNPAIEADERRLPSLPDSAGLLLTRFDAQFGSPAARSQTCGGIYRGIDSLMKEKIGLSIRVAPDEGDVCNLSANGELFAYYEEQVNAGGGSLVLKYILRGNSVKWHQTLPDEVPGVLDADPQFVATFDTELLVRIFFPFDLRTLQGTPAGIVATSAFARERNGSIRAENVAGDVVAFVDDVIKAFGGPGIFGPAERELNNTVNDITATLTGAFSLENAQLANALSFGFTRMLTRMDPNDSMLRADQSLATGSVIIALAKGANEIPAGDGRISGRVRWAKASGAPRDGDLTGGLNFTVEAQHGFKVGLDLFPPLTKVGIVSSLSDVETADFHECNFSIVGLPIDVPLSLSITGNSSIWADASGLPFDIIAGKPENFANPIVLSHPLTNPPTQEIQISVKRKLRPGDGTLDNVIYLLDRFQRTK